MHRLRFCLVAVALVLVCAFAAHADIVNPGFETGNLTGWSTSGYAQVVTSWTGKTLSYLPKEGNYFLSLRGGSVNVLQKVWQDVALQAGDTLGGWAAWAGGDYLPWNDTGAVSIYDGGGGLLATPWSASVSTFGSSTSGPWTPWSWTASSAGTYRVMYAAANYADSSGPSYALFDTTVPEPGSLALLLTALPVGLWVRRRKQR